ncbi:MAG: DUF2334 domain-containing protein [Clostridiaceae bacterium]|nr:DUF2334 domain-containing protein [Clostridiaceae bacterium]
MKKKKKILLRILSFILSIALLYGIAFYFSFFQGTIKINNGTIDSNLLPNNNFTSCYTSKINFSDMPVSNINDVSINFLDNKINNSKLLLKAQRYYIPIDSVCSALNYSFNVENTTISKDNFVCNLSEKSANINGQAYSLRGFLLEENNIYYLSISDIEYIFNLVASFNFDTKEISFVHPSSNSNVSYEAPTSGTIALIRLEDFSAGNSMTDSTSQLKLKAMGDLLYSSGIKYHIAWVPRFKRPSDNIDNDLLTNQNIMNVGFVNLLDYLINKGAVIGLHGYTHQSGDSSSLNGSELSSDANTTEEETRAVLENAIDSASALNIPYSFFESPHYHATHKQKKIIEEYFQYLYEPMSPLIYTKLQSVGNNLYIPTPLSYVVDGDTSYIEKELESPRPNILESLFYHPTQELDYINVSTDNNNFLVDYSEDSPLQRIIQAINKNGYVTIHVTELHK